MGVTRARRFLQISRSRATRRQNREREARQQRCWACSIATCRDRRRLGRLTKAASTDLRVCPDSGWKVRQYSQAPYIRELIIFLMTTTVDPTVYIVGDEFLASSAVPVPDSRSLTADRIQFQPPESDRSTARLSRCGIAAVNSEASPL